MRILRVILIFAMCIACTAPLTAAGPKWETVEMATAADLDPEAEKIDVTVRDGYIYLFTPKPVTVKVMSILGQLISEHKVEAGVSRLKISARGIYILKAGGYTTRVTI